MGIWWILNLFLVIKGKGAFNSTGCYYTQNQIKCPSELPHNLTLCGCLNYTKVSSDPATYDCTSHDRTKCEWHEGSEWHWMIKKNCNPNWIKAGRYCADKYKPCHCSSEITLTNEYNCTEKNNGSPQNNRTDHKSCSNTNLILCTEPNTTTTPSSCTTPTTTTTLTSSTTPTTTTTLTSSTTPTTTTTLTSSTTPNTTTTLTSSTTPTTTTTLTSSTTPTTTTTLTSSTTPTTTTTLTSSTTPNTTTTLTSSTTPTTTTTLTSSTTPTTTTTLTSSTTPNTTTTLTSSTTPTTTTTLTSSTTPTTTTTLTSSTTPTTTTTLTSSTTPNTTTTLTSSTTPTTTTTLTSSTTPNTTTTLTSSTTPTTTTLTSSTTPNTTTTLTSSTTPTTTTTLTSSTTPNTTTTLTSSTTPTTTTTLTSSTTPNTTTTLTSSTTPTTTTTLTSSTTPNTTTTLTSSTTPNTTTTLSSAIISSGIPSSATEANGVTLTKECNITDYRAMKLYATASTISLSSMEQEPDVQVELPGDLFSRLDPTVIHNTVTFTFSVNNTSPASQTTEGHLHHISFGVEVVNITMSNFSTPFNISFKHTSNQTGNLTCVYLNQTGSWVPDGCHTLTLPAHVVCSCDHFSLFTLMIPGLVLTKEHTQILKELSIAGVSISAFFCALTLLTHCLLYASKTTDKAMMIHLQLVGSLLLLNLLLLASVWPDWVDSLLCKVLGGLLHYALLSCFSWMGLEALHLYRLLVLVYNISTKDYMLKISLLGWGLSGVVVSIVAGIWTPYGLKDGMCWITADVVQYCSVLAYLIVVLLFNGGILILVMTTMSRMQSGISPLQKTKNSRTMCSVLGLTCILGLTWGLGFFSIGYTNYFILYTFNILNSLQGFFLFLWICIKRRREAKEHRKSITSQGTLTSSLSK